MMLNLSLRYCAFESAPGARVGLVFDLDFAAISRSVENDSKNEKEVVELNVLLKSTSRIFPSPQRHIESVYKFQIV